LTCYIDKPSAEEKLSRDNQEVRTKVEIIRSKEMGFCHGVRRALKMVQEAAQGGKTVHTLGDIVHNPQVVERLQRMGIKVISNLDEVEPGAVVIITAHGAAPSIFAEAEQRGIVLLDATCQLVERVQSLAQEMAEGGYGVIICGDPEHTEVRGILGHAGIQAVAGRTIEEMVSHSKARGLDKPWNQHRRLAILFQTTQRETIYKTFVAELAREAIAVVRELRVFNTVCAAVARREPAGRQLAWSVETVIVIGGRHSANTRHLAETCAATGVPTYHIERAEDLRAEWFEGIQRVGVTAGTSTPDDIVDQVVEQLRRFSRR
jgi:4-hydroxy-3-methylbut-2-enyl diphosphate reductase